MDNSAYSLDLEHAFLLMLFVMEIVDEIYLM